MRLIIVALFVALAAARGPRCPLDSSEINFATLPVVGECNKYYECHSDGTYSERECPENTEYNVLKGECGAPTGYCPTKELKEPKPVGRIDDHLCSGHADGHKAATNNCNSFVICENGIGHLQTCDQGLLFNQNQGYCDWAENVRCQELVGPPQGAAPNCQGRDGEMIRNNYDCSSYYLCEHNAALLYYCDNGLYFDPAINNCNWKANVVCTVEELPVTPNTPVR